MPNLTDRLQPATGDPSETPDRAVSSSHSGTFTAREELSFSPSGATARLYETNDFLRRVQRLERNASCLRHGDW
jgi:hypothetical protein